MPEFALGFKTKAEELGPDVVGVPLTEVRYENWGGDGSQDLAYQYTTTGYMLWVKEINKVYFFGAESKTVEVPVAKPFRSPLAGPVVVTQEFGANPENPLYAPYGGHHGIDIISANGDLSLFSVGEGQVYHTGKDYGYPGRGNVVYVYCYDPPINVQYYHLLHVGVSKGEPIEKGQFLGLMGDTGATEGIHLHLGVFDRVLNKFINPREVIDFGD